MTKPQTLKKAAPIADVKGDLKGDFKKAANNNAPSQFGFFMVDDMTVMEKKPVNVLLADRPENDVNSVIINVYDFKNLELMTYVQQVTAGANNPAPQVFLRPFSELASGYGIAEARDALEQLGGNPPPLSQIPGFVRQTAGPKKSNTLPDLK